ncbi:protein kinase [Thalassoglobus sp. JC818]|uniref:protein kinase domain-containing protein n=1 Tax=Thalassoglobus sp. JC818 TaxID=3232136 RepID=UPI00345ACA6B
MHLHCPHCQNPIEIIEVDQSVEVTCPSCGSHFSPTRVDDSKETVANNRARVGEKIGAFELRECVGFGAFGSVWKAWDSELDRLVALKIPRKGQLDENEIEKFLREARAVAQLNHPHVVKVHQSGIDRGIVYIASDLIDGVTIAEQLRDSKFDFRQSAELCSKIARALHHAHERGVIHRDLKPSNIMLDLSFEPHLMDFGLAKREAGEITMTVEGQILGTPAYMPPEQASGEPNTVDRRSDVYSLGVVFYEMLTGERPFRGNERLLIYQVLNEFPDPPRKKNRQIPKDLETICLKAIDKSPDRRYQTAEEFANDLQRFVDGVPIHARPVSSVERISRWVRRNVMQTIALVSIVAAIIAIAGFVIVANRDTTLRHRVKVTTDPPGARVRMIPLDHLARERPEQAVISSGVTPIVMKVKPAFYRMQVVIDDYGFHDVYRTVPEFPEKDYARTLFKHLSWEVVDGTVELPPVEVPDRSSPPEGMTYIEGGVLEMRDRPGLIRGIPPLILQIFPLYMETQETTYRRYREVGFNRPHTIQSAGLYPPDDFPVASISWDEAIRFAEKAGRRLPTEEEYEFVATQAGDLETPWGGARDDIDAWPFGPVGTPDYDRTSHDPPIQGLYSGVAEWTLSPFIRDFASDGRFPQSFIGTSVNFRVVRGGPYSVTKKEVNLDEIRVGPQQRFTLDRNDNGSEGLGFRCVVDAQAPF